ncbi:single-stranded-DNA-specific exonuclease [Paucidesulfovibrio gracilis DSM 16080]|uniref:Single-stranded-DNA-specific exonuclease RecJ n=1 Tax=Paucidesulfovibrio gracilis DSM 16080 TaxID=1121449 RepID=A0A1T4WBP9_9BACT|nr:single-stranded-DNA-specific exonuclease RecJ [Paucidesulfovibrio gracilis]SKA74549.1 single-stranded-DNA-specific exonuclease [Paucidesulfovibrio gracilis DSM 16080]
MPHIWKFRDQSETPASAEHWAAELGVSPLIVEILASRGLSSLADMDRFLSPGLRHLAAPGSIPGLDEAARILAEGLAQGRPFAVWGDYDVDGVTSTALVRTFMQAHGVDVTHVLPNRLEHGYGLNVSGVEDLAQRGIRLLLTVDCGITDHAAIARARELGMTVVVSDHHLPGETLPPAHAVCDPRLAEEGADCPCADLAGVGVAFMLMAALNKLLPDTVDIRPLLDFVALGTVADVVPLRGQNRVLVKNGLLLIKEARRPGIAALKEVSGYDRFAELGAGQIGFGLAPRINAAGRLGDPETALALLLAPDVATARPLAEKLDGMNAERRAEEERILAEALDQAREQRERHPHRRGLVLMAPHWHPGVIGIVASRVVERHYCPTLLLCQEDALLKGSGRSISEFDLHQGLTRCADLLAGYGGHRQAAGLSMDPDQLETLRERFHEAVVEQVGPDPLTPTLRVDSEIPLAGVDFNLLKNLELLQPFGMGNPEPVFATPPVQVREHRVFGKKHLRLTLADTTSRAVLPAKAWRMADQFVHDLRGHTMRFAFTPKIDRYSGVPKIELNIKDWQQD